MIFFRFLKPTWDMKTYWDNHYSLTKIHKIFIALSVLLGKIWYWYCQKRNLEDYTGLHRLHNNVTCNMSQTHKYRNHLRTLFSHASFLSQMVPLDSPCSHESGDIKFVPKKCFYGAKIHFTKCGLSFWSIMCQAPCQTFQLFHIWILLIFLRVMVYDTWW